MKKIISVLPAMLALLVSCHNVTDHNPEPGPPVNTPDVTYIDLSGVEVKQNKYLSFDLNKDGIKDFYFSTMLVGDPASMVDRVWFFAASEIDSYLPINANELLPRLDKGEDIPLDGFKGYNWYNAGFSLFVEKIISLNKPPYWQGEWKNSVRQYLPVQVMKNKRRYNGWFELSVDTQNEKLIFHRAGISNKPEQPIKAGN